MEELLFTIAAVVIYFVGFSNGVRACMPRAWKRSDVASMREWRRRRATRLNLATDDRPNLRREVS